MRAVGARKVVEVGTLAGYSALWMAKALSGSGRLVTLEVNPEHAALARGGYRSLDVSGAGAGNAIAYERYLDDERIVVVANFSDVASEDLTIALPDPDPDKIAQAAARIAEAKRPAIFVGSGVFGAEAPLQSCDGARRAEVQRHDPGVDPVTALELRRKADQ